MINQRRKSYLLARLQIGKYYATLSDSLNQVELDYLYECGYELITIQSDEVYFFKRRTNV